MNTPDHQREMEIAAAKIEYKEAQVKLSLARAQLNEAYLEEEQAYARIKSLGATLAAVEDTK